MLSIKVRTCVNLLLQTQCEKDVDGCLLCRQGRKPPQRPRAPLCFSQVMGSTSPSLPAASGCKVTLCMLSYLHLHLYLHSQSSPRRAINLQIDKENDLSPVSTHLSHMKRVKYIGHISPTWWAVVEEVRRQEARERHAKAVSMAEQSRWSDWVGLEKKQLSWRDTWQMVGPPLSFVIRATFDLLPSPEHLKASYREDPSLVAVSSSDTALEIGLGLKTTF